MCHETHCQYDLLAADRRSSYFVLIAREWCSAIHIFQRRYVCTRPSCLSFFIFWCLHSASSLPSAPTWIIHWKSFVVYHISYLFVIDLLVFWFRHCVIYTRIFLWVIYAYISLSFILYFYNFSLSMYVATPFIQHRSCTFQWPPKHWNSIYFWHNSDTNITLFLLHKNAALLM